MARLFDSARDNAGIAAGTHFYCHTHLCAVPVTEKSPDPRYCQGCYDFLMNEVSVLRQNGNTSKKEWMPKAHSMALEAPRTRLERHNSHRDKLGEGTPFVTDNLCTVCHAPVLGKRRDRRYCSARCRQRASRDGKQESLALAGGAI